MQAEGKRPVEGSVCKIGRDAHHTASDGEFCKWYDAPIVCICRIDYRVWILQQDGTPCLHSDNPYMRDAHWELHGTMYKKPSGREPAFYYLPEGWMAVGFWCANAQSTIYDISHPFMMFGVCDGETKFEDYQNVQMYAASFGFYPCPKVDPAKAVRYLSYRKGESGDVIGYDLCGPDFDPPRYITNAMPYGLAQWRVPMPMSDKAGRIKHGAKLKAMGLPH